MENSKNLTDLKARHLNKDYLNLEEFISCKT